MPRDESLFMVATYASLLVGDTPQDLLGTLARRAEQAQDKPQLTVLRAFGELRLGRPQEALNLLESLNYDWGSAPPHWVAIYTAVLGANQQREAARSMAARIDFARLRPQEQELIRQWRN